MAEISPTSDEQEVGQVLERERAAKRAKADGASSTIDVLRHLEALKHNMFASRLGRDLHRVGDTSRLTM